MVDTWHLIQLKNVGNSAVFYTFEGLPHTGNKGAGIMIQIFLLEAWLKL
jgi:hypothetical protein